jgi:hypothetical protein
MNVFEANAAELEKLRERVDEMFRERSKSPEHTAAWQEAARAFHTVCDKLAFPGGLSREFEQLRVGDLTAIEMAIRFLEANPWFFRSGYYKADILKLLRKHPLSDEQCARMRNVILERVRDRPVREMRATLASLRKSAHHSSKRRSQTSQRMRIVIPLVMHSGFSTV